MRIEEARKAFLSKENFDYLIDKLQSYGLNIDKADSNSIFGIMQKMADNPKTFNSRNNLREVDEHAVKVIHDGLKKQKMYDYREEMTKRVISEDAPLNAYFVPKPIKIPTLLEILQQSDDEKTTESTNTVLAPVNNINSGSTVGSNINTIFGLNLNQLLIKSQNRSVPLILDTRNRNLTESNINTRDEISWNYFTGTRFEQGVALSNRTINNIISIKCNSLLIPNFAPEQTNEFRQISMVIREFSDQGGVITSKTRSHFIFDIEYIGNRLRLTSPSGVENEIKFEKPISSLNTLSIYFSSPFDKITLGIDRITSNIAINKSIGVGLPTGFTTGITHFLTNGDIIYLEGFSTSNDSVNNRIVTFANRDIGHIISNISTHYFEIAGLDTFTITGSPVVSAIIYGSKRFMIPLIFNCLSN